MNPRHRKGLTLLELVVVLTILAALGGMVVPLLNGHRRQASDSTAIDSLGQVSKLVAEYEIRTNRYPNNLDSLVVSEGGGGGTIFNKLPVGSQAPLSVVALEQNQVDALALKGVTHVYDMNATPEDSATFRALVPVVRTAINGRPVANGGVVAIAPATVLSVLGASPRAVGNLFITFGFGERNSLAGAWIQEAPYRSPELGSPNDFYCRYGVVFEIPAAGTGIGEVRFVGTVLFDQDGIRGVQSLAESFYTPL